MSNTADLRRRLFAWFRASARPLPWRADRDPYRVWISEVMLQQTQVVTVVRHFERFLKRFPTLMRLAAADEHAVLRQWEGLGYYRRARGLWRAAQQLVRDRHTTIPDDPDYVRSLPGFGRYTANAVLSQAYDRRLPILEANSLRVLCRVFAIDTDPKDSATQKRLWALAEDLLPRRSAGDFNQAIMELGALVCTPTKPRCEACPIRSHCQARKENRQAEIPMRARAPLIATVEEVALVIGKRGKLLLVQRPDVGRWASMWEFPHHPLDASESHEAAACRLLQSLGLRGDIGAEIATIRHSVTRFRITLTCLRVECRGAARQTQGYHASAWIRPEELTAYPMSVPQRRLSRLVVG